MLVYVVFRARARYEDDDGLKATAITVMIASVVIAAIMLSGAVTDMVEYNHPITAKGARYFCGNAAVVLENLAP